MTSARALLAAAVVLLAPLLVSAGAPVRLSGHGDWWSFYQREQGESEMAQRGVRTSQNRKTAGVRHEETLPSNFTILNVTLGREFSIRNQETIGRVYSLIGRTAVVHRGDGAMSRAQICYRAAGKRDHTALVFEEGDVDNAFYVIGNGSDWEGSEYCSSSSLVSANLSTASGLRLGLSRLQVESILGQPSEVEDDSFVFEFSTSKAPTDEDKAPFRAGGASESELETWKSYDYSVRIRAMFRHAELVLLAVSKEKVIW